MQPPSSFPGLTALYLQIPSNSHKNAYFERPSTLPGLVICLLGLIAPWKGWGPLEGHGSLLQAHSELKRYMARPALQTVLRSEVSLGHLGEAVWGSGKNAGFGDRWPPFRFWSQLVSAVWTWMRYFSPLSTNLLIPQMEIMIPTLQGFCKDVKHLILYLARCKHLISGNYYCFYYYGTEYHLYSF